MPQVGTFRECGDVSWYLLEFARDFGGIAGHDLEPFSGRRVTPLKAALLLTALAPPVASMLTTNDDDCSEIQKGGGAVAALFLLAQLEFFFRCRSAYLDPQGVPLKRHVLPGQLLHQLNRSSQPQRINQVHQTFRIYLYRNKSYLARFLRALNPRVAIYDRLERVRNPLMHGPSGDVSSEAKLYAIILAMCYYSEV